MSYWYYVLFAAVVFVVFALPRLAWAKVAEASELLDSGAVLVDVRSPEEFKGGSAEGAMNFPLGSLEEKIKEADWPKDKAILLFCASGTRSGMALRKLKALGFTKVQNLGTVARARQVASERN